MTNGLFIYYWRLKLFSLFYTLNYFIKKNERRNTWKTIL